MTALRLHARTAFIVLATLMLITLISPLPARAEEQATCSNDEIAYLMLYRPSSDGDTEGQFLTDDLIAVNHGRNPREIRDGLAHGAVHYKDSKLPGQAGNFAVAAHRTVGLKPFADIDELVSGDLVVAHECETGMNHVYRITRRRIVEPHEVWVIKASALKRQHRILTMTTCDDRDPDKRLAVWAGYVESFPAAERTD